MDSFGESVKENKSNDGCSIPKEEKVQLANASTSDYSILETYGESAGTYDLILWKEMNWIFLRSFTQVPALL